VVLTALIISQRVFRERFTRLELAGIAVLACGLVVVTLQG
jgi:drug/metabolite transporter (DMT)-like permease